MLQICYNVRAHASGSNTFRVNYVQKKIEFLKLLNVASPHLILSAPLKIHPALSNRCHVLQNFRRALCTLLYILQ